MLSPCHTTVDGYFREQVQHGTSAFPCACYYDDLSKEEVPWHWHDELEAAIVTKGSIHVVIGSEQFDLAAGDGFFVNTSVLHSCQALFPNDFRECFHQRERMPAVLSGDHWNNSCPVSQGIPH